MRVSGVGSTLVFTVVVLLGQGCQGPEEQPLERSARPLPGVVSEVPSLEAAPGTAPATASPCKPVLRPAGLRAAAQRELPGIAAYHLHPQSSPGHFQAKNPAHELDIRFSPAQVQLTSGGNAGHGVDLRLTGYGRGGVVTPVGEARLKARRNRVDLDRGAGLVEWYVNGPAGLKQGFTLSSPPLAGRNTAEVVLQLQLGGTLQPRMAPQEQRVTFHDQAGQAVLVYGDLQVNDAAGRTVPSRMTLTGRTLRLLLDDAGARYPLEVDPALKLLGKEPHTASKVNFGHAVSISGDYALVGAPLDDSGKGKTYLYSRSGTTWNLQATPQPSNLAAGDKFGYSVSISGNTALVGAPLADNGKGRVYVFQRSGTVWSLQATLSVSNLAAGDNFGHAVSISGHTALVGAPYAKSSKVASGVAYVFTRSGTSWSMLKKLTVLYPASGDRFGWSVSLTSDTALVGVPYDDDKGKDSGSVYVFNQSGATWNEQAKLTAGAAGDNFGHAVSLSGTIALVGAPHAKGKVTNSGAVYAYKRSGSSWSKQKLEALDGAAGDKFGQAVSISGAIALVGAPEDNGQGSTYVYLQSGGWIQQQKMMDTGGSSGDQYGWSVSISSGAALVGAPYDDTPATDSGSALFYQYALCENQQQGKLTASDKAGGDQFGWAVSVSGNTALVGAVYDNSKAGSAYVYTRSGHTWTKQGKFTGSDTKKEHWFGYSVSISGNTALAGAPRYGSSAEGAAYVFTRAGTAWSQQAKLDTTGQLGAWDKFGWSVSLSGDTALVGSPIYAGNNSGAAYMYTRTGTTWSSPTRLKASNPMQNGNFGWSVSVSGNTALVGAPPVNQAYVFTGSGTTWNQQAKLPLSSGTLNSRFGQSVSISGDTALVGAPYDNDKGAKAGAVYVFSRSGTTWSQQAKLLASDAAANDEFGGSVSVSGEMALVGAYKDDDKGSASGSAYLFVRIGTSWVEKPKLIASDTADNDYFGHSVSLSGNTALVGAYWDDDKYSETGSAYPFRVMASCPNGSICVNASMCQSGFCADGVCCNTACGGGSMLDCQACSVHRGAAADGLCTTAAAGTVCRGVTGDCDKPDTCDGTSQSCPADAYKPSGAVCRTAAGPCDDAETCSGSSTACPANKYKPSTIVCRAAAGDCDVAENCSGSSAACPSNKYKSASTVCRASAGDCDEVEKCSSTSAACPADKFMPSSKMCRAAAGICDVAESCNGSSAACPTDGFKPSSTVCRAANGVCDDAENCSGSAAACPTDGFKSSSTVCRLAAGD